MVVPTSLSTMISPNGRDKMNFSLNKYVKKGRAIAAPNGGDWK